MPKDKYPSICSRQMEALVYLNVLNIDYSQEDHILEPNGGYCVYYPSNIFSSQGRILGDLFSRLLNFKVIMSAHKIL